MKNVTTLTLSQELDELQHQYDELVQRVDLLEVWLRNQDETEAEAKRKRWLS